MRRETTSPCRFAKPDEPTVEAFYLPTEHGQRFCLLHSAATGVVPRGAILYIHPFGDEMNKSRRMAALQSRAFAERGYEVLQVDLFGCGDSSGDFRNATWEIWLADVRAAWDWLAARSTHPVWLWGLRTGCLLIDAAARLRNAPASTSFSKLSMRVMWTVSAAA